MLLSSILIIATISALFFLIRHKKDRRGSYKRHKQSNTKPHNSFHCVETHPHGKSCNAVKTLHGKRFLSAEAPVLPVQNCDNPHCTCDYIHHDDRRVDVRRTDLGLQHDMYGQNGEQEKRGSDHHGRRATD